MWLEWFVELFYFDVLIGIVIDEIVMCFYVIVVGVGMGRVVCFMGDVNEDMVRLFGSEFILFYDIWVFMYFDLCD